MKKVLVLIVLLESFQVMSQNLSVGDLQTQLCKTGAAIAVALKVEEKLTGQPVAPGTPMKNLSAAAQAAGEAVLDKGVFAGQLIHQACSQMKVQP